MLPAIAAAANCIPRFRSQGAPDSEFRDHGGCPSAPLPPLDPLFSCAFTKRRALLEHRLLQGPSCVSKQLDGIPPAHRPAMN